MLVAVALIPLLAPSISLADLFVDAAAAGCATGDGSAASPVCTISAAVALAQPGDTIRIAPGTYVENVTLPFDLELLGTGGANVTTVDGGAAGSVITIPAAVNVTIEGLTVTNGVADHGGGIRLDGELTLRNSTISGNATTGVGASLQGGGGIGSAPLDAVSPRLHIEGSRISGNVASSPSFAAGGGIYVRGGDVSIESSTISGNLVASDVDVACGGGINVSSGSLLIQRSSVIQNESDFYGGGIYVPNSDFTLESSTISRNVSEVGGGFYSSGTRIVIRNSTLSENVASTAGGAWATFHPPGCLLSAVTITGNTANNGAAFLAADYGAPFEVSNCVLSGNNELSGGGFGAISGTALTSLGNNFVQIALPGIADPSDVVASDPLLGPLQDNGGPTHTHAPLVGSPLVDAGNPASFEPFDQRGVARPLGLAPDIGAVESGAPTSDLCNGDGGDQLGCTACPCGNDAPIGTVGGCSNSAGTSARIDDSGSVSVSLPALATNDLRFQLTGAPSFTFAVLSSGDAVAPTNPASPCFGLQSGQPSPVLDGLVCAAGILRRHGSRATDASGSIGLANAPWGGEGPPTAGIAQAFGGFTAGETAFFQAIHRDDPTLVCMRGLNSSQAVEILFEP